MSFRPCLQFLRPRTYRTLSPARRDAYSLFYLAAAQCLRRQPAPIRRTHSISFTGEEEKRVKELEEANSLNYPRVKPDSNAITCAEFRTRYASLSPKESQDSDIVTLRGTSIDMKMPAPLLI